MGQILTQDNIPFLQIGSTTTLTLANSYEGSQTRITVGGQQYPVSSTLTLDTSITGAGGLDTGVLVADTLYYVYAVVSAGVVSLIASTSDNPTGPTGFSVWKNIGRFRTNSSLAEIAAVGSWLNGVCRDSEAADIGYAPTIVAGDSHAPSTSDFYYRREGEYAIFNGLYIPTVDGSNPSVFRVVVPSGLTGDEVSSRAVTTGYVLVENGTTDNSLPARLAWESSANSIVIGPMSGTGTAFLNGDDIGVSTGKVRYISITNMPIKIKEWNGVYR